jgi:hypothetical protein
MDDIIIRGAAISDVAFLVETIIEAEKSGTDVLSYSTVFGLTEDDSRKYIAEMLLKEVDGCEISISSFMVAEIDGKPVAAVSAWIEGIEGIPSKVLKGNLLNSTLPKKCLQQVKQLNHILNELHIEYFPGAIQKGAGYVLDKYRGNNLLGLLSDEIIKRLLAIKPDIKEVFTQIYGSNFRAINANEKIGFKIVLTKESDNEVISLYLPSTSKVMMKKVLY